MKKLLSIIAIVTLLTVPSLSLAQGWAETLHVDFVRVDSDGRGYVNFVSPLTSAPASCTTSPYYNALAFDTNTAGGKVIYTLALTAKATGQRIFAKGNGACNVYGVMEDWAWGKIVE